MWIEIWEKLRGYDRWTEAEAVVHSPLPASLTSADEEEEFPWDGDLLVWTDHRGSRHSAAFIVPDDCTLYQKVAGDSLTIRYNPRNPEQFYLRQLYRVRVTTTLKRVLIAASIIGLVVMALWVREKP